MLWITSNIDFGFITETKWKILVASIVHHTWVAGIVFTTWSMHHLGGDCLVQKGKLLATCLWHWTGSFSIYFQELPSHPGKRCCWMFCRNLQWADGKTTDPPDLTSLLPSSALRRSCLFSGWSIMSLYWSTCICTWLCLINCRIVSNKLQAVPQSLTTDL